MIGAHLDLATLELALVGEGDLEGDARLRAWLHLGGGCSFCCGALEEVGAKEAVLERLSEPSSDPLRAALRRWVRFRRELVANDPRLSPIHFYWLGRSRYERDCLARLAIEEGRLAVWEGRAGAREIFERLAEELADSAFLALGAARWQGLRAVVNAYLGHMLLRKGASERGLAALQLADQALRVVGPDPETRAVVLMARAEVEGEQGRATSALDLLRHAETQLERLGEIVWSPGHWAMLRRLQGAYQSGPGRRAEPLGEALRLAPLTCERFRVGCASHLCLVQLAAGEIEHAQHCWEIVEASRSAGDLGWLDLVERLHRSVEADFTMLAGRFAEAGETHRQILRESLAAKDRSAAARALHSVVGSLLLTGERRAIKALKGDLEAVQALAPGGGAKGDGESERAEKEAS